MQDNSLADPCISHTVKDSETLHQPAFCLFRE